jgi:hypothetical protein
MKSSDELEKDKQTKADAAIIQRIKSLGRKVRRAFFSEIRKGATPEQALRQIRTRR